MAFFVNYPDTFFFVYCGAIIDMRRLQYHWFCGTMNAR